MLRVIRMKNRIYFLFIGVVVCTSLLLIISSNPKSHSVVVQSIVAETQNGIQTLKNHFNKKQQLLYVDNKYLIELGLEDEDEEESKDGLSKSLKPIYWPDARWKKNVSEPVIVSAVLNGQSGDAVQFLRNTKLFLPSHNIILYDLGMSGHELDHVMKFCNSSKCQIKDFSFSHFPSHVKNLKTSAFRPLIIQLVLKDAGAVLWMDLRQRLTTGDLSTYLSDISKTSGVLTWAMEQTTPTSALTHPKMFEYLDKNPEDYNFQHMVDLTAMLIYNKKDISLKLMDPWVKCALLEDCIEPIGAQSTGCRFDKKPGFRYSGCHGYDVSAFNVVIGQMFNFNESQYMGKKRFFVKMSEDAESTTNNSSITSPSPESFSVTKHVNIRNLLFN